MSQEQSPRDIAQEECVDLYISRNLLLCAMVLSTGFGKSKVAIDIIKRLQPKKVLILVNSTVLRDLSWAEEFAKFDMGAYFFQNVEVQTYQTVYKWTKDTKNLDDYFIIADEVDFAADTVEYSKFFYEFSHVKTLGLTGFVASHKLGWFKNNLPIIATLTADDAQKMSILNNIHFVFIKYDLSTNPYDIKVEYKKHGVPSHFYQSESNAYDFQEKAIDKIKAEKDDLMLEQLQGLVTQADYNQKMNIINIRMEKTIQRRSDMLLSSISSRTITKNLLEYLSHSFPHDKVIVFSKRTEQSMEICGKESSYNGKLPKVESEAMMEDFLSGDLKVLGVCDKVNRGVNIPNLRHAIFETFFSSDTDAIQKLGRLLRLDPDEVATVYVLLPYYMRKEADGSFTVQETQQVSWARSMLKSTNVKSNTVWDYRVVKTNINE